MMETWEESDGGVLLRLHVQPGARKTEWAGRHGDRLKLRVAAPPVEGAANKEVARFVAAHAGLRKGAVRIVRGEKSHAKDVLLEGLDAAGWNRIAPEA
jgi:uncharacterized protein (TIGR00251 family)